MYGSYGPTSLMMYDPYGSTVRCTGSTFMTYGTQVCVTHGNSFPNAQFAH
ncbi:predicted protein [Sclerotinia sclerotiorum 1980 UF-70]|uniref:Uncharacterized protein n=1 Tax=Sclerotinia sclerotiorum (strain ATCC 18683 / 1980 / Ss-1) TaxID=665079 RepID=A7E4A7_SCLS1|nr:predicted protein [Sclerotinia sclerotiorum 1980 UF-70]EDN90729.1 predicted protein [Sclerotinia sclerotiorum 1980 UF-70]